MTDDIRPNGHIEPDQSKRTPKVSIGLPVYNGERYLRESIDSVLAQDFTDFELFISDNASTDGTWEICWKYAAQDKRIRLHRHAKNEGAAKNFDFVLRNATAPYFMWHADDDVLGKGYIRECYNVLSARPDCVLCCGQNLLISSDGSLVRKVSQGFTIDSESVIDRFSKCLEASWKLNLPIYGMIRRAALSSLSINRPLHGLDFIITMDLSLIGKFYQLEDTVRLYRLKKPDELPKSPQQRTEYQYGSGGRGLLPHTRMVWALSHDVMASPLAPVTKLSLLAVIGSKVDILGRWLYHDCVDCISSATRKYPRTRVFLERIRHNIGL